MINRRSAAALLAAVLPFASLVVPARASDAPAGLRSFAEPGISPDGSEIAFVSGGDIWTVPSSGGTARLLVADGGTTSRPLYSPDGKQLAYTAQRPGVGSEITVLALDGGEAKRLTFDGGGDGNALEGWSHDSREIYFTSSSHNISYFGDVERVEIAGGTPMSVVSEPYVNSSQAAPSPDGSAVAYKTGGFTQWWRHGHAHIDESAIAIKRGSKFERFSEGGAKDEWPMWQPDGSAIAYVSDRTGTPNLWLKTIGGTAHQITHFTDGRVLFPAQSGDGKTIVFERNFGIWKTDLAGHASPVSIVLRGAPPRPGTEHLTLRRVAGAVLSPDGKKLAFTAHGQVFAGSSKDASDATRVTTTSGAESMVQWAPDSRRLVYVSDRGGSRNLYLYDFGSLAETRLTDEAASDDFPRFSPDGKAVVFFRNGTELRLLDIAAKSTRVLVRGELSRAPFGDVDDVAFSSDGAWIAVTASGAKSFTTIHVVRTSGGPERQISFLANGNAGSVSWSPDGTRLYYATSQRTEDGSLAQIDLIPRAPKFREDQFRELFTEIPSRTAPAAPRASVAPSPAPSPLAAAKKETRIVFEGIRDRLSLVPTGLDVRAARVSPDGKTLLLNAAAAGQANLYTYSIDELAKEQPVARQLTATPGLKTDAQWAPDGNSVYYAESGRIFTVAVSGQGGPRAVPAVAELDVNFATEKREVFAQAWRSLDEWFYDAQFHGTDWHAVRNTYAPRIEGAQSASELRRILSLMVGELNASHLGVSAPPGPRPDVADLAADFDPTVYASSHRLVLREIVPLGPLALAGGINVGDELLSVDGTTIGEHTNLDELLANRIGKRTVLGIAPHGERASKRDVAVQPASHGAVKNLRYRAWVDGRRTYVAKASGGRLGYVHLEDMSSASLQQLYIDLDTENQTKTGVVIDVRNNTGGFVDPYVIDVFNRRDYINFASRLNKTGPERPSLGQRALDLPTVLVTNEHSLSDAENLSEGYRRSHLGKIVGTPTAGWIIFTSATQLIDGSTLRLPAYRVTTLDGTTMERHPRPVDITVDRAIGETGGDRQLDAAVRELLHKH